MSGSNLSLHLYVPSGAGQLSVQPFVVDAAGKKFSALATNLPLGTWAPLTFAVPAGVLPPIQRLGIDFSAGGRGGVWFLDSIGD